jgi:hydrogenase maturation protease
MSGAIHQLVLGLGNLLLGDEGAGVHAARALLEEPQPPGTEILDVGTALLDALPAMQEADRIIALDSMKAGGAPGTFYRVALNDCVVPDHIASCHGLSLHHVLALTGRIALPEVIVLGMEPEVIHWSMELSPAVHRNLPRFLECAREEMARSAIHGVQEAGGGRTFRQAGKHLIIKQQTHF